MEYLNNEIKLTVVKTPQQMYYIIKEILGKQITVTKELRPEEKLYLRCLTDKMKSTRKKVGNYYLQAIEKPAFDNE
ncbi:MAG: hypothetical protein K2N98_09565 [Lachnospiraceae bacterium]|nr:hypothetical protein [Lachnospiraceae bacterium]